MAQVDYRTSADWTDVKPIAAGDEDNETVRIQYNPRFSEVMSYLRAVMQSGETSARVLALSADAISLNAANYSAWQVRRACLAAGYEQLLSSSGGGGAAGDACRAWVRAELRYIGCVGEETSKNYQLWHHRRWCAALLDEPQGELAFTALHLSSDAKNYHAWAHRQWVVQHWGLWEGGQGEDAMEGGEMGFAAALLEDDCRNNSAWNHRWFILTRGCMGASPASLPLAALQAEVAFALGHIGRVGKNECPWVYLRAVMRSSQDPLCRALPAWPAALATARTLYTSSSPACHVPATEWMAEVAEEGGDADTAARLYKECAQADAVRQAYWLHRAAKAGGS